MLRGLWRRRRILPKDRVTFDKSLVVGECVVNQPGCFWRRGIMDTAGYLNDDLHYGLDYEYWIRLALAGAIFMRLPDVVAYFRLSQESKTVSQTTQMAEEQLDILDELLEREDLPKKLSMSPDQLRQQAKRTRANIQLHAFYGAVKSQEWGAAWKWLSSASREDPTAIFQQRWIDLAIASLRRRLH